MYAACAASIGAASLRRSSIARRLSSSASYQARISGLPGSEPVRIVRLQPFEVPAGVAECVLGGLPGLVEPLPRVFAQRLEQEEAFVAERLQQALVEERRELVEVGSRDRLGGVEGEGAAKDREAAEGGLGVRVEEVVAPLDRRAQRSLPFRQIDRAARQQRQRLVEALQQGGGREELHPRRGELDREREVVQAPADRSDRSRRQRGGARRRPPG